MFLETCTNDPANGVTSVPFGIKSERSLSGATKCETSAGGLPAYAHALASSIRLVMAICLLERLPAIQCRTLLVWGERDQVLPVDQARVALNLLRNGGLELIPGCGHVPQLECPETFLRTIERFLG